MDDKKQLTLTCKVDNYRAGWTLVEFLAHRFKYHTREGWEQRVRDRSVRLNGDLVDPDHVVKRDDSIAYTIWHTEPEVDFDYEVLHEDDHLLAVSKSGNIPVHACGVFITHTLIARLREDFGPEVRLGHRLDRETSGVVLLGKTPEAARSISQQFERGEVEKEYLALVYGEVESGSFEVDAPIGKVDVRFQYPIDYEWGKANDKATYLPKRVVDLENGKPSSTGFTVARRGDRFTLLRARPLTGRTNQIRVHLHHIGHPIVGDKIYALDGELRDELLKEGMTEQVRAALVLDRHALHCERLTLKHPETGEPLTLAAETPAFVDLVSENPSCAEIKSRVR